MMTSFDNEVMTRDMDLVRQILLQIEAFPDTHGHDIHVDGHTDDDVTYHLKLLSQAGLIEAIDMSSMTNKRWLARSVTWDGHEFLDAARSDNVWTKAKDLAVKTTGAISLESLKLALSEVTKLLISGYIATPTK